MKTTKEKKDAFIAAGSEIADDLLKIFGKYASIVIADIGACDGLSTIIYANLFPNARLIAFEPIIENYNDMICNLNEYGVANRMMYTMPVALGDKNSITQMWRSHGDAPGVDGWETGNKSSSLLRPTGHLESHKWCEFTKDVTVPVHRIDDMKLGTVIDFVHMDVQGAELIVLNGGINTFSKTTAIWVEVSTKELYEGQPLKHDIQIWMDHHGFRCIKDTCDRKYGDMLFVRK